MSDADWRWLAWGWRWWCLGTTAGAVVGALIEAVRIAKERREA